MIEKKAGSQIRAFKELAFPLGFSKKRGAGDRTADAGAKRAKEEGVEVRLRCLISKIVKANAKATSSKIVTSHKTLGRISSTKQQLAELFRSCFRDFMLTAL